MTLVRINIVLAVLLVIVVTTGLWLGTSADRRHYEFLPDMKYSPAYGSYDPNPEFSSRQTLQSPVPGTIARDEVPLHYKATPEDAIKAGEELKNPIASEGDEATQSVDRGAQVYRRFCVACHGGAGKGDGPVAKRGFPPPPSLLAGKSIKMKDGQLFHILTYGQGSMPSMAAQLPPRERWDAINYIRQLQKAESGDETAKPNGDGADAESKPEPAKPQSETTDSEVQP